MTTPSKLKPGAMVRRKGEPNAPIFTFVARHGSKYCRCQCDRYKGLDGPDDAGFVDVSDWDMARKYERVFVRPNSAVKTEVDAYKVFEDTGKLPVAIEKPQARQLTGER